MPRSTPTLQDSVVLITGANGGLGQEFVRQSLERGAAKVYATARTPREWGDARVVPLVLDVLQADSIATAVANSGDTTVVVNNAAIFPPIDSLLHGTNDEFRRIFDTNFFGAVEIARAFGPVLAANGGGSLINVNSAASWCAGNGAYSASKAALWSATNSLRVEMAEQNTHVLGLFMGYVDTPMVAHVDADMANPDDVVRETLDGLESGKFEVLADDYTRMVKKTLAERVEAMYPELSKKQASESRADRHQRKEDHEPRQHHSPADS